MKNILAMSGSKLLKSVSFVILVLYVVCTTYIRLLPSWFDDLILLAVSICAVLRLANKQYLVSGNTVFRWVIVGVIVVQSIIVSFLHNTEFTVVDYVVFLKPLVLVEMILLYEITKKEKELIAKIFLFVQVPNLFFAYVQAYMFFIHGVVSPGMHGRDGSGSIMRASGFAGHTTFLASIAFYIVMYLLYEKRMRFRFFLMFLWVGILVLTFSRFASLLTIAGFVFYLSIRSLNPIRFNYKAILSVFCVGLLGFFYLFCFTDVFDYLSTMLELDSANTIRAWSWKAAYNSLSTSPFFGSGISSFGTLSSLLVNPGLYNSLGIDLPVSVAKIYGNFVPFAESGFARVLVQLGIVGTINFFLYYFAIIKMCWEKSKELEFFIVVAACLMSFVGGVELLGISIALISNIHSKSEC